MKMSSRVTSSWSLASIRRRERGITRVDQQKDKKTERAGSQNRRDMRMVFSPVFTDLSTAIQAAGGVEVTGRL